jgi:hypothetical protein
MDSGVAHERIIHSELEMAIINFAPSLHERLIAEPIWRHPSRQQNLIQQGQSAY